MRPPGITLVLSTTLFLLFALLPVPALATPILADRIVAVVGATPITLSELRERARPILDAARKKAPAATRASIESEVLHALLQHMIDETLEAEAAKKAKIGVDSSEVQAAFEMIAHQNKITVVQLIEEAKAQGFSEHAYAEEVTHQILEGKMLQIRVLTRGTSSSEVPNPEMLDKERSQWLDELRRSTYVDVRLLSAVPSPSSC